MFEKVESVKKEILNSVASSKEDLEAFRLKFISRKSLISELFADFKNVNPTKKKEFGVALNELKNDTSMEYIKLNKKIAKLLHTYIIIMENQKKKLNINNEDIIKNVLKSKEKEKNKVTKRLGDLTVEEREVENIHKNHRLGNWNLGQTRALFEYDENQYDKERKEIEDDFLMELRLNRRDEVTDRNREIYRLEEVEEQVQRERMNTEIMASFAAMADDDDYGERDGDESY